MTMGHEIRRGFIMEINEILSTLLYGVYALILMFVGYKVFDVLTPYDFAKEIKDKNPAIGAVIAGIFISVAIMPNGTAAKKPQPGCCPTQ